MTLGAKNSTPEVGVVSSGPPDVGGGVVSGFVDNFGILHISVSQHFVEQVILAPDIIPLHTVSLRSEQVMLTV